MSFAEGNPGTSLRGARRLRARGASGRPRTDRSRDSAPCTGPYDIVTFDCYGTLIDWESGLGRWFGETSGGRWSHRRASRRLAAYAEIEPDVEARAYRSYREVLAMTALRVAKRLNRPLGAGRALSLAESPLLLACPFPTRTRRWRDWR